MVLACLLFMKKPTHFDFAVSTFTRFGFLGLTVSQIVQTIVLTMCSTQSLRQLRCDHQVQTQIQVYLDRVMQSSMCLLMDSIQNTMYVFNMFNGLTCLTLSLSRSFLYCRSFDLNRLCCFSSCLTVALLSPKHDVSKPSCY